MPGLVWTCLDLSGHKFGHVCNVPENIAESIGHCQSVPFLLTIPYGALRCLTVHVTLPGGDKLTHLETKTLFHVFFIRVNNWICLVIFFFQIYLFVIGICKQDRDCCFRVHIYTNIFFSSPSILCIRSDPINTFTAKYFRFCVPIILQTFFYFYFYFLFENN